MGRLLLLALAAILLAHATASAPTDAAHLRVLARQTGFFDRRGGPALLARAAALSKRVEEAGGCGSDVCFALDGSASLSGLDFQQQREFAQLTSIVASAGRAAAFSAVQYGDVNTLISNGTSDADLFVRRVTAARFARAPRSFVSAGLLFCTVELARDARRRDRIVLLGDGGANFGPDTARVTDRFLPPKGNGAILAVGVGLENRTALAEIAGTDGAVVSIVNQANLPDTLQKAVEFLCEL